jgi:hypothetical protein
VLLESLVMIANDKTPGTLSVPKILCHRCWRHSLYDFHVIDEANVNLSRPFYSPHRGHEIFKRDLDTNRQGMSSGCSLNSLKLENFPPALQSLITFSIFHVKAIDQHKESFQTFTLASTSQLTCLNH